MRPVLKNSGLRRCGSPPTEPSATSSAEPSSVSRLSSRTFPVWSTRGRSPSSSDVTLTPTSTRPPISSSPVPESCRSALCPMRSARSPSNTRCTTSADPESPLACTTLMTPSVTSLTPRSSTLFSATTPST
ncbi:hypothetical protein L596_006407 [Steinernema carpocapsae]|uniref:Uncharacterized protein n=1 Tax=Steinernema carpocapsae TaxID=34508 RepID=A0A4U8V1Z0_STECR|nr:hypothetical protein L596_006407 [Steinernema carpocapsae]